MHYGGEYEPPKHDKGGKERILTLVLSFFYRDAKPKKVEIRETAHKKKFASRELFSTTKME